VSAAIRSRDSNGHEITKNTRTKNGFVFFATSWPIRDAQLLLLSIVPVGGGGSTAAAAAARGFLTVFTARRAIGFLAAFFAAFFFGAFFAAFFFAAFFFFAIRRAPLLFDVLPLTT
jgi:hypothetical protein